MDTESDVRFLLLTCRFTENHFHGIRIGSGGDEESDWPPSPGRAFQALVNASLGGINEDQVDFARADALAALRDIEALEPPQIDAHPFNKNRSRFNLALPLNNPKMPNLLTNGLQLAPHRKITSYECDSGDSRQLLVRYVWKLPKGHSIPIEHLEEMAARVSYIGRAEDRVELNFSLSDSAPELSVNSRRWIPSARGAMRLSVPETGTIEKLRHLHRVGTRLRNPSASSCLKAQLYRYADQVEFPQPVFVGILQLNNGIDVLSIDPLAANRYRAQLRAAICERAQNAIHWSDPKVAIELISGHDSNGRPTQNPHLAIVPLPSLSRLAKADGEVRRFALVGYSDSKIGSEALEIYQTLHRSLESAELIHDGVPTREFIQTLSGSGTDIMWSIYSSASRIWSTVFPVVLTSKFDVPKTLTGNARHHRRNAEVAKLIRRALRLQELDKEMINAAEISVSASPFVPKTSRAERYSFKGNGFVTHVRIVFPYEVMGPVILGDRRFSGMGLCFPD